MKAKLAKIHIVHGLEVIKSKIENCGPCLVSHGQPEIFTDMRWIKKAHDMKDKCCCFILTRWLEIHLHLFDFWNCKVVDQLLWIVFQDWLWMKYKGIETWSGITCRQMQSTYLSVITSTNTLSHMVLALIIKVEIEPTAAQATDSSHIWRHDDKLMTSDPLSATQPMMKRSLVMQMMDSIAQLLKNARTVNV